MTFKSGDSVYVPDKFYKKFSSCILGSDVEVFLSKEQQETKSQFTQTQGPLESPIMPEWEREIVSVSVEKKNTDGKKVNIFKDKGCVFGYADSFGLGFMTDLSIANIGDKSLSAIIVPEGMAATIYTEPELKGHSVTIVGPA